MPGHWRDVEEFAVETATEDLELRGEVAPLLVAFAGEEQCFLAFLRWFAKGEYADPMIELLSLAMALRADRLAFSTGARLTSLLDPVEPVTADGDLRQRALVLEVADGHHDPTSQHSVLHPFDLAGGRVDWGQAVRLTGGRGWIPGALGLAVEQRESVAAVATEDHVRAQVLRCLDLGHDLFLGAAVRGRLGLPDRAPH